jgi:hypothetical protein
MSPVSQYKSENAKTGMKWAQLGLWVWGEFLQIEIPVWRIAAPAIVSVQGKTQSYIF